MCAILNFKMDTLEVCIQHYIFNYYLSDADIRNPFFSHKFREEEYHIGKFAVLVLFPIATKDLTFNID